MKTFGNVVALAQRQTASNRSAGARGPLRIECVNVEGEVDGGVGANVGECKLHDTADAVTVDVVHAESADVVLAEDEFFGAVDVAEANVDEFAEGERRRGGKPVEGEGFGDGIVGGAVGGAAVGSIAVGRIAVNWGVGADSGGEAGQECNGHTVHIAAE